MKKLSLFMAIASLGLASCSSSPPPVTSSPFVPQIAITGLIPPIDPDSRRKEVSKGKQDPFLLFPIKATQQVKAINSKPKNSSIANNPGPIKSPPIVEKTPEEVPKTDLANDTLVSGVISIGNNIKILLKAPNENNTRYVQVGQYISNGQILVKRVENPNSSTPIVVLEENGQEVYKKVGQAIIAEPTHSPQPGAGILIKAGNMR